MKITTIIDARPQFIKAAPVSRAIAEHNRLTPHASLLTEVIIHTGQHYDDGMSGVFFRELEIPEPDVNLGVGSGSHGRQTGQMLMRIEEVLLSEKPDWVLVYGDTNSTLAGALATAKLHIPVAHVEAGLRSFNREMPEEHNRVLTDHMSDLLFCPTETAVRNLEHEGITRGVCLVGDVMYDSILYNITLAEKNSGVLDKFKLKPKSYALATVHRAENTDNPEHLTSIFRALDEIAHNELPVIVPLHPRTKQFLANSKFKTQDSKIDCIDPVSYLDMLLLEKNAHVILTDSGGVQKEAYWFKVPCVTLRDETEWVETVEAGWNVMVGSDPERIMKIVQEAQPGSTRQEAYGNGRAAERIIDILITSSE